MANYTMRVIMENFEAMLVERPFNKITVSALVERCGISSNTFYYHFQDIYALLNAWLVIKEEKYESKNQDFTDWPEWLKRILKDMQKHSKLVYHISDDISKTRMEDFVFGKIQKRFYELAKHRTEGWAVSEGFVKSLGEFYCYSLFGFVLKFLWDRMDVDVDEAVNRLKNIFYGITKHMIMEEMERMQPK